MSYVHSMLYELSMTACLFYHECCIGIPPGYLPPPPDNSFFPSIFTSNNEKQQQPSSQSQQNQAKNPQSPSRLTRADSVVGTSSTTTHNYSRTFKSSRPSMKSNRSYDLLPDSNASTTTSTTSNQPIQPTRTLKSKHESARVLSDTNPTNDQEKGNQHLSHSQGQPATQHQQRAHHSLSEASLKYAEIEQAKLREQQFLAQQKNKSAQNSLKLNFFKKHNLKENDAEIIQYLAEVIKLQQSQAVRGVRDAPPLIKLDYSQVFLFELKKKTRR
eukprot:TRINITY_DN1084_c5_g1_i2.p1 TRINITY_DN1084_c5_g1~~TRINITY_DN1084_c5_g1_i2.p1  ORF type:complete len:272 (-),score=77.30 TRINITY_DN1084_c5_g1_i2:170-985(-)